jgi:hypothetical protein
MNDKLNKIYESMIIVESNDGIPNIIPLNELNKLLNRFGLIKLSTSDYNDIIINFKNEIEFDKTQEDKYGSDKSNWTFLNSIDSVLKQKLKDYGFGKDRIVRMNFSKFIEYLINNT